MRTVRPLLLGLALAGAGILSVCGACAIGKSAGRTDVAGSLAEFSDHDEHRERLPVRFTPVARGFDQPTAFEFVPGREDLIVVLQKEGKAFWASTQDGRKGEWLEVPVLTASEEGLLGIAFHPRFAENGRFFLNYVAARDGEDMTHVDEWAIAPGADLTAQKPKRVKTLLTVVQPYPNHNGGHVTFGPDGFLYIGLGDGGFRADPLNAGQDLQQLLGKMLRIDVDRTEGARPYGIPPDNPFVGRADARPEIFAYGLRNPWRYSFDPQGRLVVADVGQDLWEELSFAPKGANLGWRVRESRHCFRPKRDCASDGMIDPFYEYDHVDGRSITGGHVYTGSAIPQLAGRYVFADFTTGRFWAVRLPSQVVEKPALVPAVALGRWPLVPVSFAQDPHGALYVADFAEGGIHRLDPP